MADRLLTLWYSDVHITPPPILHPPGLPWRWLACVWEYFERHDGGRRSMPFNLPVISFALCLFVVFSCEWMWPFKVPLWFSLLFSQHSEEFAFSVNLFCCRFQTLYFFVFPLCVCVCTYVGVGLRGGRLWAHPKGPHRLCAGHLLWPVGQAAGLLLSRHDHQALGLPGLRVHQDHAWWGAIQNMHHSAPLMIEMNSPSEWISWNIILYAIILECRATCFDTV